MSLSELLDEAYDNTEVSSDLISKVLEFVDNNETVISQDIFFIKRLTKVCEIIYKNHPDELPDCKSFLEKAYKFNLDGVDKIRDEKINGPLKLILISHLHGHAAEAMHTLYKKTNEMCFLEKSYKLNIYSAETAEVFVKKFGESELEYCYIQYLKAAKKAKKLFSETTDVEWLIRGVQLSLKSANLSEVNNKKHSIESNDFARKLIEKILFLQPNNEEFLRKAYQTLIKVADYYSENDAKKAHAHYCQASGYAHDLLKQNNDLSWLIKHYEASLNAAKTICNLDASKGARSYWFASRSALNIARALNNSLDWLIKAYEINQKAFRIIQKTDQESTQLIYSNKGLIAKIIYYNVNEISKKRKWARKWTYNSKIAAEIGEELNPELSAKHYKLTAEGYNELIKIFPEDAEKALAEKAIKHYNNYLRLSGEKDEKAIRTIDYLSKKFDLPINP